MEELIERLWSIEAEAQKNLPTPLPYVYAEAAAALEAQAAKIIALEARLIEEDHTNAMGADELLLDIAELRAKLAELEAQEPVGEVSGNNWDMGLLYRDMEPGTPLFARPVPAEGAKDAERWRYFKHCFDHPMERRELARRLGCSDKEFDPDLDAAIDSAMAKDGK